MSAVVLPELTPEGAERLSERIGTRLETIATNYLAVMPLIREAVARNAHAVLGYPSPGAYIKDRFGESLAKLGAELRREVVRELSSAGLSTRAIAPVVGVSNKTVHQDLQVLPGVTPDAEQDERVPVVGIDGKTYNPVVSIKTKDTHETIETFDAVTGEAVDIRATVAPSDGVTAYLEADESLQDRRYVSAFAKAMTDGWLEFDAERIARIAPDMVLEQIEIRAASVARFAETVKRGCRGLRAL